MLPRVTCRTVVASINLFMDSQKNDILNLMNILICWIGNTDLVAAEKDDATNLGPIAQAIKAKNYSHAIFLDNYRNERIKCYHQWLTKQTTATIEITPFTLSSPTNHKEIYEAARTVVHEVVRRYPRALLTFHISPGTPAMALVWMLLAPTCGAKIIESSRECGVQQVQSPFEISAYFLPDRELSRLTQSDTPAHPAFKDILHRSDKMCRVVKQAIYVAPRDVTILIEGESGTGKELFARAIHLGSLRAKKPFIPVNCGAIPAELLESQLFGYCKGAFTGAQKDTPGFFQAANGGTLFLDELGEMPLSAQVKLLRALEERAVVPVGGTKEQPIDVRIIAATNRNLLEQVVSGHFRSDLFYRLAVGILHLPPLRERGEDLDLLIDNALAQANEGLSKHGGPMKKIFSDSAKNIMKRHPWFGNVRELNNTIIRAALWSPAEIIDEETVQSALLSSTSQQSNILDRALGNGFSLDKLMDEIDTHYLARAMHEAGGVKAKAAQLLGLKNYQTLSNRLKRCGLK